MAPSCLILEASLGPPGPLDPRVTRAPLPLCLLLGRRHPALLLLRPVEGVLTVVRPSTLAPLAALAWRPATPGLLVTVHLE